MAQDSSDPRYRTVREPTERVITESQQQHTRTRTLTRTHTRTSHPPPPLTGATDEGVAMMTTTDPESLTAPLNIRVPPPAAVSQSVTVFKSVSVFCM